MAHIDIPYYLDFLPQSLLQECNTRAKAIPNVPGLSLAPGIREQFPNVETDDALRFVVQLYEETKDELNQVLVKRQEDRAFMDQETLQCLEENKDVPYLSPDYQTVLGRKDQTGRLVAGPLPPQETCTKVDIPASMEGEQVTLFGPPDSPQMAINAMNALHRKLPNEPAIVTELVEESGQVPRWGADNEDSMTPTPQNIIGANQNLIGCYDRTLTFTDEARGKHYALAEEKLSKPIKRIPGLALPDGNHLYNGNPLPLHILDFGLQLFHNWQHPEALVFYVPKLENEEEATYLKRFIERAERTIKELHPAYQMGSIRLFIVFENPRAIFRIREIAEALAPYFVGGSLGWHDFLASAARLFKFDPNYRIPVKADPNIVINHIKESHLLLAEALTPIGGIKIGGMYGILYEDGNEHSFEVCMVGYIKDVIVQLKRGLDGFWVAHPNFVRMGLAIVQAWRRQEQTPGDDTLDRLIKALVPTPSEQEPLLNFVHSKDAPGLEHDDPLYLRGVLAADLEVSDVIPNDHPDEVRYNIFQALQYLADWLRGNGCVALPALMHDASGAPVFVRIMDDLATTERSRWELWAELFHKRVSHETFETLLREEIDFIKSGAQTPTKRVQIFWNEQTERWYPIAIKLLKQLVMREEPVEFATELLIPFTLDIIRDAEDPWKRACELCPGHYQE